MKIALGADHRGFLYKEMIKNYKTIGSIAITWIDIGTNSQESCDYPDFAHAVSQKVQNKEVDAGILLCGSGIGMAIVANRYKHIYAGLVWNKQVAQQAKQHDNINILVLPSDYIEQNDLYLIVEKWLTTPFNSGKYQKRLDKIDI